MKRNRILYLSQTDVTSIGLEMAEIIDALEAMFREKAAGRTEMPPKPGIHPFPDAFIHAMPAMIPARSAAGIKWVSGYPQNVPRGLPYISGLLILNDFETGVPIAVMDCVWITAQRTGAATAVAAKRLARADSSTVGILGCGVQGRSNLEALAAVLPLRRVMAYDSNFEAARRYGEDMSRRFHLDVRPVSEPQQAVTGCDVVVTAGPILKVPHATIQAGWLEAGAFASLVDYDSYWHPDALKQADCFFTDDIPQIEYYRQAGYFQNIPPITGELGDLVAARHPGRRGPGERTFACNLGIALDDMATAPLVYQRAVERGIGTWLPL